MPEYGWKGIDRSGAHRTGTTAAPSQTALKEMLFGQGIALTSCKEKKNYFQAIQNIFPTTRISTRQLANLFHNLSLLVASGIPLSSALSLTQQYVQSSALKSVLRQLLESVNNGAALSSACQNMPSIFSPFIVSMIKSGERSGALTESLTQISQYLNQKQSLSKKLRQAALLPSITFALAILITLGIFIFIIPQFEPLFAATKQTLPTSTKFLLSISNILTNHHTRTIVILIFLLTLIGTKLAGSSRRITAFISTTALHTPGISQIIILSDLINFSHTLAMLLSAGNPLKTSLDQASSACANDVLRKQMEQLATLIDQGYSLELACKKINSPYLPEHFVVALALGEQTGKLDKILSKMVTLFQEQLDSRVYTLTTVFQPVLLIILGLFIAFIMLSVYLPVFNTANIV